MKKVKDTKNLVSFLLRSGIALSFLYASISSFLQPTAWIGFFPIWLTNLVPGNVLVTLFSIFEIILAIWLISNKKIYYASIVSIVVLALIIIVNIKALDIIFRDIPILFAAIALLVMYKDKRD